MRALLKAFAVFCLLLNALPAAAREMSAPADAGIVQQSIGHIVAAEGSVSAGRTGKPLAADEPVFLEDIIVTGPNARAVILFIDDTQITLGENAQLSIDSYVFDADAQTSDQGHFSILKGAFLLATGLINKSAEPDMQVNTAYGSIGLRGTTIWGGMTGGQFGVYVQEGSAVVENKAGAAFLKQGEASYIQSAGQLPVRVGGWSARRISGAMDMVQLRDPQALQTRLAKRQAWNNGIRAQMRESLFLQRQRRELQQQQQRPIILPRNENMLDEKTNVAPAPSRAGLEPIMKQAGEPPRQGAQRPDNRPDFLKNLRVRPNINNRARPND